MEKQFILSNRPFIGLTQGGEPKMDASGKHLRFNILLTNAGCSPAVNCKFVMDSYAGKERIGNKKSDEETCIMPGVNRGYGTTFNSLKPINDIEERLWIRLKCNYEDLGGREYKYICDTAYNPETQHTYVISERFK